MVLLFLLFLNFSGSLSSASQKPDVLFVFFDAGETLALEPVLEKLDDAKANFKILLLGASQRFFAESPHRIDLKKDCGVNIEVDNHWARERKVSESFLEKVQRCVETKLVVTGVVSQIQFQLGQIFSKKSKVVGYFDGFSDVSDDPLVLKFMNGSFEVWVPENDQKDEVAKIKPSVLVKVVGQPSVEKWSENRDARDPYSELDHYNSKLPTILYAGGYGQTYSRAFKIFLDGVRELKETHNIVISLHPKVDGTLEKKMLAEAGMTSIIVAPKTKATRELARSSSVVVSQDSTVGIQSLFMEKRSIYVDVPGTRYKDFAVRRGLIPQVFSAADVSLAISAAEKQGPLKKDELYRIGGIPQNSTNLIFRAISAEIKN